MGEEVYHKQSTFRSDKIRLYYILYFGGSCKSFDCFNDSLYELNTLTLNLNEIITTTTDNIPMRKHGCGMTSFNIKGKSNRHSLSNGERSGKGALEGETYSFLSGGLYRTNTIH